MHALLQHTTHRCMKTRAHTRTHMHNYTYMYAHTHQLVCWQHNDVLHLAPVEERVLHPVVTGG